MKRKLTEEQERVAKLLEQFKRLPENIQDCVIGYTSGVADAVMRYRKEETSR